MQGRGGNQPSPPPTSSASDTPTNFTSSFQAIYLHSKGHNLPLRGAGCEGGRNQSPDSQAVLKGCSCGHSSGGTGRGGTVGQLSLLQADPCYRKMITASRNQRKASHHPRSAPAQEGFCSQCLLRSLPVNCWSHVNPQVSLHHTKAEAMCCWPSCHLHAAFFLLDYFCVCALQAPARHEPGSSCCGSAPARTGAAKGNQMENHSPDLTPLLQGQGSPIQVGSLALG